MGDRWGARPALTAEAPPRCAEPPFFSVPEAAPPARETRTPGSERRRSCEKRPPPSAGAAKKTPPRGGKKKKNKTKLSSPPSLPPPRSTNPNTPGHAPVPPLAPPIGRRPADPRADWSFCLLVFSFRSPFRPFTLPIGKSLGDLSAH